MLSVLCFQDFLKYNESYLKRLPCQIFDPIPLGEGAGVGWLRDVDSVAVPEGTMLYELVKTGIEQTHTAVGVVVRLRQELSLVKDMPVLIAVDQVRNMFLDVKIMLFFFFFFLKVMLYFDCLNHFAGLPVCSIIIGLHLVNTRNQSQFVLVGQYMLENLQWLVLCVFIFKINVCSTLYILLWIICCFWKSAKFSCILAVIFAGNVGHPCVIYLSSLMLIGLIV